MEKKEVPFYQYVISLICVAFLTGSFCYLYFDFRYTQAATSNNQKSDLQKVDRLYNEIVSNYVGEVDEEKLIDGALQGMTEALDDPYTSYLSETEAESLSQSISGSFEGIGATLSIIDEQPTVSQAPISGTPAEIAGLKTDDIILEIDGKKTEDKTLSEIVNEIRGEKGSKVNLLIQRGDETFNVDVVRDTIAVDTVTATLDEEDETIGVLEITSFSENTSSELRKAIEKLRKEGATSFLIDVRKNPGGVLDQVEEMASMFLEDGQTIVQFEDKEGNVSKTVASKELDQGFKVTEPTVVLVDGDSASASEIFAAALKESGNKKVIGTTTYGKGTVQTIRDFNDNSEIKLSILKWLTPDGNWIHEEGLEPSIEAGFPDYAYLALIPRDETLKENDSSASVKNLNGLLKALGYDVDDNSEDFSAKTKQAILSIQEKNDLPETGEVDEKTANLIEQKVLDKIEENDGAYQTGIKELEKER